MSGGKLTDSSILAAPLPAKGYKALTDGRRLFLRITPDGGRFWRLKFVAHGKESQASLGKYPDVSIEQARALADAMREGGFMKCDQCEMVSINGHACHEIGCPNGGARWDGETWIKQRACFICGYRRDADDLCCDEEELTL